MSELDTVTQNLVGAITDLVTQVGNLASRIQSLSDQPSTQDIAELKAATSTVQAASEQIQSLASSSVAANPAPVTDPNAEPNQSLSGAPNADASGTDQTGQEASDTTGASDAAGTTSDASGTDQGTVAGSGGSDTPSA